ncbi:MAG: CvpA family protein [Ruminococcaceae bacterium]|nr:CvpA family protein [Oscillospiraceae bacterium]
MKELIELLNDIATDLDFHCSIIENDEEKKRAKADDYFRRFIDIYARIERHKYSDVTKYIDRQLQDTVDSLRDGVRGIISCAEANEYDTDPEGSDTRECYKKINKLCDHIELEAARYSSIKKIQWLAESYNKRDEKMLGLLDDAASSVEEAHNRAKGLSEQLISILGIFAGIIVTFSFATTVVGETVANITKSDVVYLGFAISVLGAIFLNLIAFLLSFVTKLSGHSFSKKFPWLVYIVGNLVAIGLSLFFFFKM